MTGLMSRPDLQHHGHLVPGLVHLPAVDALDREHVEDDRVPVDGHLALGDAEHGDLAAVAHVGEHVAEGRPGCRTFPGRRRSLPSCRAAFGRSATCVSSTSTASVAPIFFGQVQAIRVHVGDDDVAGAGVPDHRRGHDADRPGAGDQHVLAQHVERQGGVHGVAERIEDRLHVAVNAGACDARRWSSAATDIRRRRRAG